MNITIVSASGTETREMTHDEVAEWEARDKSLQTTSAAPYLFASVGFSLSGGLLGSIELAAQLQSAYYEDGWMIVAFSRAQESLDYLVFVQTDIPAKVEQFKDLGFFELVFSDPTTGDPVEPGRIDLQILKVR